MGSILDAHSMCAGNYACISFCVISSQVLPRTCSLSMQINWMVVYFSMIKHGSIITKHAHMRLMHKASQLCAQCSTCEQHPPQALAVGAAGVSIHSVPYAVHPDVHLARLVQVVLPPDFGAAFGLHLLRLQATILHRMPLLGQLWMCACACTLLDALHLSAAKRCSAHVECRLANARIAWQPASP